VACVPCRGEWAAWVLAPIIGRLVDFTMPRKSKMRVNARNARGGPVRQDIVFLVALMYGTG